jgi:hypothetical protein
MATIRIHCRQEDGEVVTYTPTEEKDFRDPTDFAAYLMAQERGETVTLGCVIAEYVREEESSSPCQSCGEDVPETEAHGDPDTEYLCPTCPSKGEEKPPPVFTTYQHFNTRVIRRLDGSTNGLGLVAADLAHCMDGITGEDTTHWNHPFDGEGPESSVWSDVDLDDHSKAYCKVLNEWAARHNVEIYD